MLYENFVIRISLYVNSDIYIMLYASYNCGPLQVVIYVIYFPLSYKLSTGVSTVQVLKKTFGVLRIHQGQHTSRSPPDVGFDFWFLECKCKSFCNSGVCVSTRKWDLGICTEQFKHHYGGSFTSFISLWNYILNGPTNVRKTS